MGQTDGQGTTTATTDDDGTDRQRTEDEDRADDSATDDGMDGPTKEWRRRRWDGQDGTDHIDSSEVSNKTFGVNILT